MPDVPAASDKTFGFPPLLRSYTSYVFIQDLITQINHGPGETKKGKLCLSELELFCACCVFKTTGLQVTDFTSDPELLFWFDFYTRNSTA